MVVNGQFQAPVTSPLGKVPPNSHLVGGWMGHTASLNASEKRKISYSSCEFSCCTAYGTLKLQTWTDVLIVTVNYHSVTAT
jgi:hypothetical protein